MIKNIAFVGCPNVGKSTIINHLCKTYLAVGNYNGVTTGFNYSYFTYNDIEYQVTDLPGIFDLDNPIAEEITTFDYLMNQHIDIIVNVVNSCDLIANLRLSIKLKELQIPMIILLNFDHDRIENGIVINQKMLTKRLSVPIVNCENFSKRNIRQIKQAIYLYSFKQVNYFPMFNPQADYIFKSFAESNNDVLKDNIINFKYRYNELYLEEYDNLIINLNKYVSKTNNKKLKQTNMIDAHLLYKPYSLVIMLSFIIVAFIFVIKINDVVVKINTFILDLLNYLVNILIADIPNFFNDYINDVILTCIESLVNFIPLFTLLYLVIILIEESGYMARINILLDKIARLFHLSGRMMISLFSSFGCNVVAIKSLDAISDNKLKRKSALLIPFCSCSARLPIYIFFINYFFKDCDLLIIIFIYGIGVLVVFILSIIFSYFDDYKIADERVYELSLYRMPKYRNVINRIRFEIIGLFMKIVKIIFIVMTLYFILLQVKVNDVALLVHISKLISIIFIPLGFGENWIYTASIIPGIFAKESVIISMDMLLSTQNVALIDSKIINLIYMVFTSLMTPCIFTLFVIKEKYGLKLMIKSIIISAIVPYVICFVLYNLLLIL